MRTKVFVGNLDSSTDQASLRALFAAFGAAETVDIVTDFETGLCKGFGFVVLGSYAEAQTATEALNGRQPGDVYAVIVSDTAHTPDSSRTPSKN